MVHNRKIKFAVIGCGHIGKRHIEMIRANPDAELVAIVDLKDKGELGLEHIDAAFFNSLEEFVDSDIETDVVNVATPNGFHAEQALKCLDARLNVVIEKPMALTKSDAERLIFKALHVHKHVFVVMQNRYSPPSVWIKELLDKGKLGEVFMVQVNCYWNRDDRYYKADSWHGNKKLDGGTLYTQFSHFIDIMYWLFGDIDDIHCRLKDFAHGELTDFEDSGLVTFEFVNGGVGCINFSTAVWDQNMESSMTVIAEKGSVKIGGQYMNEVEFCHVKDYLMPELPPTNPGNDYGSYKGSAANHHYVIENVVEVLQGKAPITTNALEGLKVVDIIERIYAAAYE